MGILDRLRRRNPVDVQLFTRPGCGLCEEMKAEMRAAKVEGQYRLVEVDVDSERGLKKRYGLRIPVLTIAGRECFEGRLDRSAFRKAIQAARASSGSGAGTLER